MREQRKRDGSGRQLAPVAREAEQAAFNRLGAGSSPAGSTLAGLAYWSGTGFPSQPGGFDSRIPLNARLAERQRRQPSKLHQAGSTPAARS